jgi:RimJ/RimL family protein N-acetyltransferase
METHSIKTARLELVSATPEILRARVDDRDALASFLGARVPGNWPPELYDQDAVNWTAKYLAENADAAGWVLWFILLRGGEDGGGGERTAIGCCGYKGKPTDEGTCEIGYGLLPQFQRAGYASEAASALIRRAFAHEQVTRVVAETYPELTASIRVMEKNGLRFAGDGSEERVIRYELTRADWERRVAAARS